MFQFDLAGTRRHLAVLAVAVLVLTAGCAGLGGSDDNGSDLDNPGGEDPAGEDENTDDDDDGGEQTNSGDEGEQTNSGDGDEFDDLDSVEENVTGEALLSQSVSALESETTFQYEQELTLTQEQNNQVTEATSENRVWFDRANQAVQIESKQDGQAGQVELEQYILNGTVYAKSEQNAQQFGSEWVQYNISDSFDQQLNQTDAASQFAAIFENATATLKGETEIDGKRVYVITTTVDEQTVKSLQSNVESVSAYQQTVYLSADSGLPVRINETSDMVVTNSLGQQIEQRTESSMTLTYGSVEITLPDAATDAPKYEDLEQ